MWILTQNGERILSTDSLDEITVSDPVPGKNRLCDNDEKKDRWKRICFRILHEERACKVGSSGNYKRAGTVDESRRRTRLQNRGLLSVICSYST